MVRCARCGSMLRICSLCACACLMLPSAIQQLELSRPPKRLHTDTLFAISFHNPLPPALPSVSPPPLPCPASGRRQAPDSGAARAARPPRGPWVHRSGPARLRQRRFLPRRRQGRLRQCLRRAGGGCWAGWGGSSQCITHCVHTASQTGYAPAGHPKGLCGSVCMRAAARGADAAVRPPCAVPRLRPPAVWGGAPGFSTARAAWRPRRRGTCRGACRRRHAPHTGSDGARSSSGGSQRWHAELWQLPWPVDVTASQRAAPAGGQPVGAAGPALHCPVQHHHASRRGLCRRNPLLLALAPQAAAADGSNSAIKGSSASGRRRSISTTGGGGARSSGGGGVDRSGGAATSAMTCQAVEITRLRYSDSDCCKGIRGTTPGGQQVG